MKKVKRFSDMLGVGLLLLGFYVFLSLIIDTNLIVTLFGIIGALTLIVSQTAFLWQKFIG